MREFKDMLLTIPDCNIVYLDKYLEFIKLKQKNLKNGERHHILPRCLFPEYKSFKECPWNIINLRSGDHFIAHYLLYKAFPERWDIALAWNMMLKGRDISEIDIEKYAEDYERARIKINEYLKTRKISEETREKLRLGQLRRYENPEERIKTSLKSIGRKLSEDHKKKLSEVAKKPKSEEHKKKLREREITQEWREHLSIAQKNRYKNLDEREKCRLINLGRKHTEKSRKAMSEGQKKRNPHSEEVKKKISDSNKGRKFSDDTRKKMSENGKGKGLGSRWMNKDGISKSVKKDDINNYLSEGWSFGRIS